MTETFTAGLKEANPATKNKLTDQTETVSQMLEK